MEFSVFGIYFHNYAIDIFCYLIFIQENQVRLQKVKARRKSEDEEGKPAWSPASRTIPFGR